MANIDMPPEGLAKRLFVLTIVGVIAYVTAVVLLISSPDDPSAAASGTPAGAVARADR